MKIVRTVVSASLLALLVVPACAQVAMQGSFVASRACPALVSIKKQTNPGNVSVVSGQSYMLLGKNKDNATYYWIEVKDAQPRQRWVAIECGTVNGSATSADSGTSTAPAPSTSSPGSSSGKSGKGVPFYVLALSWEPTFCKGLPDKVECKAETAASYDASHLSLHGLWPQPRNNEFCNVGDADRAKDEQHKWEALPEPDLSAETRKALDAVMPGTQSLLERHEYLRHGTCYPATADVYFRDAARLAAEVNNSAVGAFIAANAGKTIQTRDLMAKFDEAFGKGAGARLRVACKSDGGTRLISELTLGLKGDIPAGTPLKDLLAASSTTGFGCPGGLLDAPGPQ